MNKFTVLFGVLLCLVAVNGRHFAERSDTELSDEPNERTDYTKAREHSASQLRHRRKRWQTNYGYHYPAPPNPYYPEDRRDFYDRNQHQDQLPQIMRLLDEISAYVRNPPPPPPPPQIIYVPYAVPYPVPQACNCQTNVTPNITNRFPEMEDPNQNWGFEKTEDADVNDGDGSRPLTFENIKPHYPTLRPPPEVEHGSDQAASDLSTKSPRSSLARRKLRKCDAAVLSCCRPSDSRQQKMQCFSDLGCVSYFADGRACRTESIKSALQLFEQAYSPSN